MSSLGHSLSAVRGVSHDLAVPLALPTSAGLVALVPLAPAGHEAVHGHVLLAGLGLLELAAARQPSALCKVLDPAMTIPLAILAAPGPLRPVAIGAIPVAGARLRVAHPQLLQGLVAKLSTVGSVGDDDACSLLRAAAARVRATAPFSPLGDHAVLCD